MNLTQAAKYTKRLIVLSIILIILGIASFIGYKIWKAWYIANQPRPEIKPDQKFGQLPSIQLPTSKAPSSSFTYSIDTTTGNLPTFDRLIKVYFMPKPVLTLLSSDRSKELAGKFGLKAPPITTSETKYSFNETSKSLSMDIDSGNFKYINPASPSAQTLNPKEEALVTGFRNVLSSLNLMKPDLGQGPYKVQYFRYGIPLVPVTSIKDANVARVSIWPDKIEDKPILTSDPNISMINGIFFGTSNELKNYIEINYTYWPTALDNVATYYLKPSDKAFEDLKLGNATVIQLPTSAQVSITNVYLAYFLPDTHVDYLQPIYIFSGPSFIAYVSAITDIPPPTQVP